MNYSSKELPALGSLEISGLQAHILHEPGRGWQDYQMVDFKGGIDFLAKGGAGKNGGSSLCRGKQGGTLDEGGRGLKKGGVGILDGTMDSLFLEDVSFDTSGPVSRECVFLP